MPGFGRKQTGSMGHWYLFCNYLGSGFRVHGWRAMKIERFEDIEAWQPARELTRKVYRLMNSKMCTSRPGEHVPPFVASSTISRNMKTARLTTLNREP